MKRIMLILLFLPFFTGAQIITTIAGNGTTGHTGDNGPATLAELGVSDIAVDSSGNIYVADPYNQYIRKISSSGIISTFAGTGYISGMGLGGYSGDGGPATNAELSVPLGVAVDNYGNVYIADAYNSRIRKVDNSGIITTIAGTGVSGHGGDGGPATDATIGEAMGITIDQAGNIYMAINGGASVNCIRKINTSGIISTIAGGGGNDPGNGLPATSAFLVGVQNVSVDRFGNIYIAESGIDIVCKINTAGILSVIAGQWQIPGDSGDGGPATAAELNWPMDVAIDKTGNLYIPEYNGNRVRLIDTLGNISTIAGTGALGFSGDGGAATSAKFESPYGIALDIFGDILIGDEGNNRVRLITMDPTAYVPTTIYTLNYISLYPNPCYKDITITAKDGIATVAISNFLGQTLYSQQYNSPQVQVDVADLPAGVYLIRINGTEVRKFVKE